MLELLTHGAHRAASFDAISRRARYLMASAMSSFNTASSSARAARGPTSIQWRRCLTTRADIMDEECRHSNKNAAAAVRVRASAQPRAKNHRRDRRADSAGWTVPDGVSHGDVARQPTGEHVHPSHLIPPELVRPEVPDTYKKKPVALLMGYVGIGYSGNTVNAALPRGQTIDDVLEDALFDAGCVLLSNYRSRALSRLKWSRSSRTDKGVSSLATVVSARLEVDVTVWDEDPEGRRIAADINRHLPEHVRVFGAYSTPKSFQARRACVKRTYDYLLPAKCLGLNENGERDESVAWPGRDDLAGSSGADVMKRLREALHAFEGSHYFHNYTRRSTYAPDADELKGGNRRSRAKNQKDDEENETEGSEPMDAVDDVSDHTDDGSYSGPEYAGSRSSGYYWLKGRDDADLIGVRHARKVNSFVAGDVETLSDSAGVPFVRLTVNGDSFMLYQIRKMIATAVAVALGHFPAGMIAASLARPARVATPIAPASTLYLTAAEFMSFRPHKPDASVDSASELENTPNRLDVLEPGADVVGDVRAFQKTVLDPALAPALGDEEWDVFVGNLPKLRVTEGECGDFIAAAGEVLEAHGEYVVMREERRRRERETRESDEANELANA